MCQTRVYNYLKDIAPKRASSKDIAINLNLAQSTINKNIRGLIKINELDILYKKIKNSRVRYYTIK